MKLSVKKDQNLGLLRVKSDDGLDIVLRARLANDADREEVTALLQMQYQGAIVEFGP